jgi:hypothetical protein
MKLGWLHLPDGSECPHFPHPQTITVLFWFISQLRGEVGRKRDACPLQVELSFSPSTAAFRPPS